MSGFAIIRPVGPRRLIARRRSRCWECDGQMQRPPKMQLPPLAWWYPQCHHVVSYNVTADVLDAFSASRAVGEEPQ